jgi:hypothetical protein
LTGINWKDGIKKGQIWLTDLCLSSGTLRVVVTSLLLFLRSCNTLTIKLTNLHGLSPRANYTDRCNTLTKAATIIEVADFHSVRLGCPV